ncbi:hypothetical protein ACWEPC_00150, partial [Nonomuraea sp. NPDC004297]
NLGNPALFHDRREIWKEMSGTLEGNRSDLWRAMAVVSSDREVAESVRRMGARPVPSGLLLRRLGRA